MSLHRERSAFDARLQYLEKIVTDADLTAGATSQAIDFDDALPADAFVLGGDLDVTEAFSDGGAGTFLADLGLKTVGANGFVDGGANNLESVARVGAPRGTLLPYRAGGETPQLTVTSSVNVNTATAGRVVARVYYFALSTLAGG